MSVSVVSGRRFRLLGHHQTFQVSCINLAIVNLHLCKGIVDLTAENLTPKVISECLKVSASIFPSFSKHSKDARMTSSSSEPPAILEANNVTICVKFIGPSTSSSMAWVSPPPTFLP